MKSSEIYNEITGNNLNDDLVTLDNLKRFAYQDDYTHKTLTNLSQLGFTNTNANLLMLCVALPVNTTLQFEYTSAIHTKILSDDSISISGQISIHKGNNVNKATISYSNDTMKLSRVYNTTYEHINGGLLPWEGIQGRRSITAESVSLKVVNIPNNNIDYYFRSAEIEKLTDIPDDITGGINVKQTRYSSPDNPVYMYELTTYDRTPQRWVATANESKVLSPWKKVF